MYVKTRVIYSGDLSRKECEEVEFCHTSDTNNCEDKPICYN